MNWSKPDVRKFSIKQENKFYYRRFDYDFVFRLVGAYYSFVVLCCSYFQTMNTVRSFKTVVLHTRLHGVNVLKTQHEFSSP